MKYIRQLDGLRAIAVTLVIIAHWFPEGYLVNRITNGLNGSFGVNIFFVLSGFLITRILLQNRLEAEENNLSRSLLIKNFFFRRALRIFPIYYITISLLLIFHRYTGTVIRETYPYYYTYTANLYFHYSQEWDGILSHLWSLSVEEQFYLLWPWVILFVSKQFLKRVIYLFIIVGVVSNHLLSTAVTDCFTTSCFDAFGLGALLSWQVVYHPETLKSFCKVVRIFGVASAVILILFFIQETGIPLFRTFSSLVALWAITSIIIKVNARSLVGSFLNNRVLVWIGKVSYGLYLYHLLIPYFFDIVLRKVLNKGWIAIPEGLYQTILLSGSLMILLCLAWLSWHFIEKPFLNLKRHFDIQKHKTPLAISEYAK